MDRTILTKKIKQRALELGFISCGISKSEFLEKEAKPLENWLNSNMNGSMSYMENYFDKRLNPKLLVDDSKSVISVLLNYFPKKDLFEDSNLKISKYAYGIDYHVVIKNRLNQLVDFITGITGEINARVFTDSAPVLEKAWAERSGLGWVGKNGNLITQKVGSFYFLGEIILDLVLEYDEPVSEHCGSCTLCLDACPTGAIIKPYVVDGSKCISYLTIELKDELIPVEFKGKMEGWVYGCDICQDVCPWNRFSKPNLIDEFAPLSIIESKEIFEVTESQFSEFLKHSPIKRTRYKGLKRNIQFIDLTKK